MMVGSVYIGLGTIAALLQVLGYFWYFRKTVTGEINPNPLTWYMFGYGTALLFALELEQNATWEELYLPGACAVCGIIIATTIWRRALKEARQEKPEIKWYRYWPKTWSFWHMDEEDIISLALDYLLTVGYIMAWCGSIYGWFGEEKKAAAMIVFLALSNLGTLPSFVPILRETAKHPDHEHWLPWSIWALAYGCLLVVTWDKAVELPQDWTSPYSWNIEFVQWISLLVYPAMNVILHGLVAVLALLPRKDERAAPHTHPCE